MNYIKCWDCGQEIVSSAAGCDDCPVNAGCGTSPHGDRTAKGAAAVEHDPFCWVGEDHHVKLISGVVIPACSAEACELCCLIRFVRRDEAYKWHTAQSGGLISREQAEQIGANIGQHGCASR